MVDLFKSVFDEDMFADLYYVDENPANVRTINVYKLDGQVHAEEEVKQFELGRLGDVDTSSSLKHNFFVKLNFQWHPVQVKYFSGGWIARIIGRRNPRRIQDMITTFDWVIATQDVIDELTKLKDCHPADQSTTNESTEMMPLHVVLGTTIYRIPEDIVQRHGYKSTFYCGHRRSITPVIHQHKNEFCFNINTDPDLKKFILK
jgi:hypothetical protein